MAQSLRSFICRKGAIGISNWISGSTGISNWFPRRVVFVSQMSTVSLSDESVHCPSSLPPAFEGGDMVHKFFSIAEHKVLSFREEKPGLFPGDEVELVGSSHGWIALFNRSNCDLFLSNPLSGCHVKLPPIHTLPIPKGNLAHGCGCVTKVIISCSPEEEDCRAMMTYSPSDQLAFCCPGRSTEWTPLFGRNSYEFFVYSTRQKIFFCVTSKDLLDAWDLGDPQSPRLINFPWDVREKNNSPVMEYSEELDLKEDLCMEERSLVINNKSDQLFLVRRFYHATNGR